MGCWGVCKILHHNIESTTLPEAISFLLKAHDLSPVNEYIDETILLRLTMSYSDATVAEAFKFANMLRNENNYVVKKHQLGEGLSKLYSKAYAINSYQVNESKGSWIHFAAKDLDAQELKETYIWIRKMRVSDMDDFPTSREEHHLGLLSEAADDLDAAFKHYSNIVDRTKGTVDGMRCVGRESLNRVVLKASLKGLNSISIPKSYYKQITIDNSFIQGLNIDHLGLSVKDDSKITEDTIKAGDILLLIDGKEFENADEFFDETKNIFNGGKTHLDLLVLRSGKLLLLKIVSDAGLTNSGTALN